MSKVTPELLLDAYRAGIFPMAEDRRATDIAWFDPVFRGILPIRGLHVPKRLARTIYRKPYTVTFDTAFERVIRNCADTRQSTWINDDIIALYTTLHKQGHAHSVEAWDGRVLAGGVYGISIGGAFFGESMFSVRTDASKIALVYLVARLWRRGYTLFDTQYVNDHLKQFGVLEIPRAEYRRLLKKALLADADFNAQSPPEGRSSLPSSNEPGSLSSGGTAGFAPGAAGGVLSAGFDSGLAAGAAVLSVAGAAGSSASGDASAGSSSTAGSGSDAGGVSAAGLGSGLITSLESDLGSVAGVSGAAAGAAPLSVAAAESLLPSETGFAAFGAPLGAVSDENTSDFDVAAFLQSITQTS